MLIAILFHEVIINKCICDRFYSVHCTYQFSQLNEYTSSEVELKSEVRAHHASVYLSIDTRPSLSMTRSRQRCHQLKTWCAGGGGGGGVTVRVPEQL